MALRGATLGLWDWQVLEDRFSQQLTHLQLGYAPGEVPHEGIAWRQLMHTDDVGRVIATFEGNPGSGVLTLDGKMLDKPHLVLARRLIARAG